MNKNIILNFNFLKKSIISLLYIFLFFQGSLIMAVPSLDNIIVETYPKYVKPGDEVTLTLKSYTFNIDSADTTISANGKVLKQGIGLKKVKLKVGDAGNITTVFIKSKKLNGDIINREFEIIPASVDLVYELANPNRPFNYKGKSEAISNSELTIFAFPNIVNSKGQRISKDSLIYTWYKNYNIDTENSGFGKSSYKIKRLDAYPMETKISVKVTNVTKSISAESSLYFNPQKTEIEFYLLDPSLPFSFWNIANQNTLSSKYLETNILAVPYFIDTKDGDIKYTWSVDGKVMKESNGGDNNTILLLNSLDNFTSKINLSLTILNKYRLLQSAQENIDILFNKIKSDKNEIFFEKGSFEEGEGSLFGL